MKNLLTKSIALGSIVLLMLAACKKDGTLVVANSGKAGALTASSSTLLLNSNQFTDTSTVVRFNFTQANYGYQGAVTNTLQIDAAGDNWANPYSVALTNKQFTKGFNTADFNNLLLKLNLRGGVTSQVSVRVQQSIGTSVTPIYTNVVPLTVTPFNLKAWLYVAGAYEGWANPGPNEDSLYSATNNGIFVGIINFTAGNNQFLVLPAKNWTHKYATNDPQGSTSSTVKYDGPNNFYAPATAGQYQVTINVNANTISFALVNSYSIIGDAALGWGTDSPMKYINDGSNSWVATLPLVSTGQFKVRQNNDWTYSWGIPKPGTAGDGIPGTLNDSQNNNITVSASGTHTVTFTVPVTLSGVTPPVTATYTVK
jgi:hypothetical protein